MQSRTEFSLEIEPEREREIERYSTIKKIGDYMLVAGVCTLGVMSIASYIAMFALIVHAKSKDRSHHDAHHDAHHHAHHDYHHHAHHHAHHHEHCNSSGDSDFYRLLCFWYIFNNNDHDNRHSYRDQSSVILVLFLTSFIVATLAVYLAFVYAVNFVACALLLGWGAGVFFTIVGAILADYANDKLKEINTPDSHNSHNSHTIVFAVPVDDDLKHREPYYESSERPADYDSSGFNI